MSSQDHPLTRSDLTRRKFLLHLRLNPSMYTDLSYEEKDDERMALVAVVNKLDNYINVPDRLKKSKKFLLSVLDGCIKNKGKTIPDEAILMSGNGGNMWFWNAVNKAYLDDEEVCLKLLEAWTKKGTDGFPLWRLTENMQNNYSVAKKAILLDPHSLKNLGASVKSNVELACLAMTDYPSIYSYADSDIKKDGSLIKEVFDKSVNLFFEIEERFSRINEDTKTSIDKFLKSLPKKNDLFYMSQFEATEELLIRAVKDFPAHKPSIANSKAMRLIVEHLSEQKLRTLVNNTRTTLGTEMVADAVFQLDVTDISKKETIKVKKNRKLGLL